MSTRTEFARHVSAGAGQTDGAGTVCTISSVIVDNVESTHFLLAMAEWTCVFAKRSSGFARVVSREGVRFLRPNFCHLARK